MGGWRHRKNVLDGRKVSLGKVNPRGMEKEGHLVSTTFEEWFKPCVVKMEYKEC
jgi:hypothetical protein